MKRTFVEAIHNRRSIYQISNNEIVGREALGDILLTALSNVPSAFNSRSTRLVLLTADNHTKFWQLVKDALQKIVPAEAFGASEHKINTAFASGYATVLFYEDMDVVGSMQEQFPTYADRFPTWAEHTSAMHQLAVWTMVEDAGLGASLQHYNPLIDSAVADEWNIPQGWKLIAQMPLGSIVASPEPKPKWEAQGHCVML